MSRDAPAFEPRDFIRYLRTLHPRLGDEIRLPTRAVIVFSTWFFRVCSKALGARLVPWNPNISVGRAGKHPVAVVRTTIGAPAAAIDLEESIALGARTFIVFGTCGSLQRDLYIGQTVLPISAVSDEGTSRHYAGRPTSRPNPRLVHRLRTACRQRSLPVREGPVWTTDAVYQEGRSRIRALARRGVLGVEMECSALFTVARYRRAAIAALLVVSDEVGGGAWHPAFQDLAVQDGVRRSLPAVDDVMSGANP